MFKALLPLFFLFSVSSNATGYLIHSTSGERIQITGVTTTVKAPGLAIKNIDVNLLSGPSGSHQCTFPLSALMQEGYKDIGSFVLVLANPNIQTLVHCYTSDGKAGSTSSVMIDTRF